MIRALKEYNETVMKPSWNWMKKHWKGYSVFVISMVAVECIYFYWSNIKAYIRNKFKKAEEEP